MEEGREGWRERREVHVRRERRARREGKGGEKREREISIFGDPYLGRLVYMKLTSI